MRSRGGVRVLPRGWEVGGESKNLLALGVIERHAIGLALALVFAPSLGEGAELVVPVGLERIGDQPVGGIDVQVALASELVDAGLRHALGLA